MLTKSKKIVIIALLCVLCCLTVNVFADSSNEVITMKSTVNNTNNTLNTNTNTNTNNIVNTSNNTNNTVTKLAKTGTDTTIVFLVVIFGISTIYAYKKIKDFNNM